MGPSFQGCAARTRAPKSARHPPREPLSVYVYIYVLHFASFLPRASKRRDGPPRGFALCMNAPRAIVKIGRKAGALARDRRDTHKAERERTRDALSLVRRQKNATEAALFARRDCAWVRLRASGISILEGAFFHAFFRYCAGKIF